MPDAQGTTGPGTAPKIAIVAAIVAVLMSLAAVIVVSRRGGGAPAIAGSGSVSETKASAVKTPPAPSAPSAKRVAAADVMRLRREVVTLVRDAGKVLGVRVNDEDTRKALDLEPDDIITAISGHAIERELDVFEAMFTLKHLRVTSLFIELLHDGKPALVRWQVDGDMRTARLPDPYDPRDPASPDADLLNPFDPTPLRDPLVDTIKKLDDLSYEVPRSTIERVFASRSSYARVARTVSRPSRGGFAVYAVRPGTIVSAIGITNGDAIRAINGNPINSADELADLYPQIKDADEWRVDLSRRGRPILLTIAIK